jgi:hypothetical protein
VDSYEVIIGLHVAGAVILEISAIGLLGSVVILTRSNGVDSPSVVARGAGLFDKGIPAGAALVLVTGFYMIMDRWGLRQPWPIASLAALVGVAPLAPLLISPEVKRLQTLHRSPGRRRETQPHPGHGRLLIATAILTSVSLAELLVMAIKPPGTTAATELVIAAIAAALTAVVYLRFGRSQ